jgi:hypothetical protein
MREELREFREEALDRKRAFHEAEVKLRAWERAHPQTLDSILDWIDQMRSVFGEQSVDRRPWVGEDFRL